MPQAFHQSRTRSSPPFFEDVNGLQKNLWLLKYLSLLYLSQGYRKENNSKPHVERNRALTSKMNPHLTVVGSMHFLQSPAVTIKGVPQKGR